MTSHEAAEVRTIGAGGFRVVIAPREIEVTRDKKTFDPSTRKTRLAILLFGVIVSCLMLIGQFIRIDVSRPVPIAWAPHAFPFSFPGCFLPLTLALGVLYSGTVNLSCTQDKVQTTWIRFGKVRRILSFPKNEVTRFQYVDGLNPFGGRSSYLCFSVGERIIKCLPGLKCVEAKLILNELERMGFDVVSNPALA
ncbi:MAG: hypothetical protein WBQ94_11205, partial [Terracidiphilus sp.]